MPFAVSAERLAAHRGPLFLRDVERCRSAYQIAAILGACRHL
jgi:hypothetical protein